MVDKLPELTEPPPGYAIWLADLKRRIDAAQQRAALAVNTELLSLYWQIGREILDRQAEQGWGSKVVQRLSHDLREAFPGMRGFSVTNLKYMRTFAASWSREAIGQQPIDQLPWGHQVSLLLKLKDSEVRLAYAASAAQYGWSRSALDRHIQTKTVERRGHAITNFDRTLPQPQSELVRETLKDPYKLDFLGLLDEAPEREIEQAVVNHLTQFLVELGAGFAYVGRQVRLEVGGDEFFIDLLFYHLALRRYLVIEIKAGAFKPAHLGQLAFYLTALDATMKHPEDGPTLGLLLCKTRNEVVAEYALRDYSKPLGVSEYRLLEALPEPILDSLPSIEEIEREMTRGDS